VSECDREASVMRRPWPTRGCCAVKKKNKLLFSNCRMQVYCNIFNIYPSTRHLTVLSLSEITYRVLSTIFYGLKSFILKNSKYVID
jgi:hypothetical protein